MSKPNLRAELEASLKGCVPFDNFVVPITTKLFRLQTQTTLIWNKQYSFERISLIFCCVLFIFCMFYFCRICEGRENRDGKSTAYDLYMYWGFWNSGGIIKDETCNIFIFSVVLREQIRKYREVFVEAARKVSVLRLALQSSRTENFQQMKTINEGIRFGFDLTPFFYS